RAPAPEARADRRPLRRQRSGDPHAYARLPREHAAADRLLPQARRASRSERARLHRRRRGPHRRSARSVMAFGDAIRIKTRREVDAMRSAARHVAEVLLELRELAKPGLPTAALDPQARQAITKRGVTSSFLGYGPHGLPPDPAVARI